MSIPEGYKRCTKCGGIKSATKEFFEFRKDTQKLRNSCRQCKWEHDKKWISENYDRHQANQRQWRELNREHKQQYNKKWQQDHLENHRVSSAKYRKKHPDRCVAATKKWRKNHLVESRATYSAWYYAHHDKMLVKSRNWRKRNPEKIRLLSARWASEHREEKRLYAIKWRRENTEYFKKWVKENPDKVRRYNHLRRARKASIPATFTDQDWQRALTYFNGCCAYCQKTPSFFDLHSVLHQEHHIAQSKNGGYTPDNILPACQSCNLSKWNKDVHEWLIERFGKKRGNAILERIQKYFEWITNDRP